MIHTSLVHENLVYNKMTTLTTLLIISIDFELHALNSNMKLKL